MMNKLITTIFIAFLFSILLTSCMRSNIYENNVAIPFNKWDAKNKPEYTFDITDTSANYTMYLTMRHTDAYPYSNIWMRVTTKNPGETKDSTIKIEIPLAQQDGKWLGRGMNEIWEHRMPLATSDKPLHFSKAGFYKVQLEQIMRVNPLPEVMSVGIRLEKNPS